MAGKGGGGAPGAGYNSAMSAQKIAVVTGANRGIGLGISRELARRGLHVVLTARDEAAGRRACDELRAAGLPASFQRLDVASGADASALAAAVKERHGGLDVLVNNAGISMKGFDAEVARQTIAVNYFGAARVYDALLPLMREQGRVVMISSAMGHRIKLAPRLQERFDPDRLRRADLDALMHKFVADVAAGRHSEEGWPTSAYSVSKIGLTALTAILSRELRQRGDPRGILVNATHPGWVRTGMGGDHAPRSVEEGADTPVWLALLPADGPTGGFFEDRRPAAW